MKKIITLLAILLVIHSLVAQQNNDLNHLLAALLADTPIEEDLQELCDQYGGRVTGTEANEKAIDWGLQKFQEAGVTAQKEPFTMAALWVENSTIAKVSGAANFTPKVVAKYFSKSTPEEGITAAIIDVGYGTAEDFERAGDAVKGNFVLVEHDLCLDIDGLFKEYSDAARADALAAAAGAIGIINIASRPKKLLYRFIASDGYDHGLINLVMGREDALRCQRILRDGGKLDFSATLDVSYSGEYTGHNVIAEIEGSEKPEEVVVIGAHIDSWGLGTGANDNGCNVTMMIDIARQMLKTGVKPRRTIRFALWNGEEQGYFGSLGYTQLHQAELDQHIMKMSVDIGSGGIIGFFTNGRSEMATATAEVMKSVAGLGAKTILDIPVVGTDNFDFMLEGVGNLIAIHKPFNYGQNYHAESDTYDKVDLEQLKINSAIVAAVALGYANLPDDKVNWKRQTRAEIANEIIKKHNLEFSMRMFGVWNAWIEGDRGRKK